MAQFDEMPRHTLILDQETRWSSTHTMLERFLLQKKQFILVYIQFEKFGIQILENRDWEIWPSIVALLKIFADVLNFCDKENSCISVAVPSAKFIVITLQETGCKRVVELKKAIQQSMDRYFHKMFDNNIQFHRKKPAICDCNSAGSKI